MPLPEVRGGIAISGIYDLEPLRLNYLNEKIRETDASRSTGADRRGQVLWPTKSASSWRVVSRATKRNIGTIRKNDRARSGSAVAIECDVAIQPTIAGARAPPALPNVKAVPTAVPRICVGNNSVL